VILLFCAVGAFAAELLQNPGFEETGSWTTYNYSQTLKSTTDDFHSGASSYLLNWKRNEAADRGVPGVKQEFTIPSGTAVLHISFWYKSADANSGLRFRLRESGGKSGLWYYDGAQWQQATEEINFAARSGWAQGDKGTNSKYNTFAQVGVTEWTKYELQVPTKAGITSYTIDFLGRGSDAGEQKVYVDDVSVTGEGIIRGQVQDVAARPLVGVQIQIGSSAPLTSGPDGKFEVTGLEPGTYDIHASLDGYGDYQGTIAADGKEYAVILLPAYISSGNLISNGDCEGVGSWGIYTFSQVTTATGMDGSDAHSGSKAIVLNWKRNEAADRGVPGVMQEFSTPAGAEAMLITFWYKAVNNDSGLRMRVRESGAGGNLWYYGGAQWLQAAGEINRVGRTGWAQGDQGTNSQYYTFAQVGRTDWAEASLVVPLKVGISNYTIDFLGRGGDAGEQKVFVDDVTVKFVHSSVASVAGKVRDAATNLPALLPGAQVSYVNKTSALVVYTAQSDEQGNYAFDQILPGAYTLRVSLPQYKNYVEECTVLSGANSKDLELERENVPITISAFTSSRESFSTGADATVKATQIQFAVSPSARVTLEILDAGGNLVAILVDNVLLYGVRSAQWDGSSGEGFVQTGNYTIRVVARDGDGKIAASATLPVAIKNDGPAAQITEPQANGDELYHNLREIIIKGTTGEPLAPVTVYIKTTAGTAEYATTTDITGAFSYLVTLGDGLTEILVIGSDALGNKGEPSGALKVNYDENLKLGIVTVENGTLISPKNPLQTKGKLWLSFYLKEGSVKLAVFAANGREIYRQTEEPQQASELTMFWDGTYSADGQYVPDGLYTYKLFVDDDAEPYYAGQIRVKNAPSLSPLLVYPLNEIIIEPNKPLKFSWEKVSDAVYYLFSYGSAQEQMSEPVEVLENAYLLPQTLAIGDWFWQVQAVDLADNRSQAASGTFTIAAIDESTFDISGFVLAPNPFSPNRDLRREQLNINFVLRQAGSVKIAIYNLAGNLVKEIKLDYCPAGTQVIAWNGEDNSGKLVPTGPYLLRLVAKSLEYEGEVEIKRMIMVIR
jgi:flagellar hook assembly protein FlgD